MLTISWSEEWPATTPLWGQAPAESAAGAGRGLGVSKATAEALMLAYAEGDLAAFDGLYALTSPKLFGFLLHLTKNRERAEDLLQVTYSKIHRARGTYLPDAPFMPWAIAIARRSFYDEIRARKARKEELSYDGALPEPPPEDSEPSPVSDALEEAMSQLPENYREAIVLTKLTGLSLQEAAAVTGATTTAMKLRVHRGYQALRELLAAALTPKESGQ